MVVGLFRPPLLVVYFYSLRRGFVEGHVGQKLVSIFLIPDIESAAACPVTSCILCGSFNVVFSVLSTLKYGHFWRGWHLNEVEVAVLTAWMTEEAMIPYNYSVAFHITRDVIFCQLCCFSQVLRGMTAVVIEDVSNNMCVYTAGTDFCICMESNANQFP